MAKSDSLFLFSLANKDENNAKTKNTIIFFTFIAIYGIISDRHRSFRFGTMIPVRFIMVLRDAHIRVHKALRTGIRVNLVVKAGLFFCLEGGIVNILPQKIAAIEKCDVYG
jgi:hypothetical protein